MTRRHENKYRICRQLGENIWNVSKIKFKIDKTPGEHGKKHRKNPDNRYEPLYSTQLKEKQKIKKYYSNLNESQFRHYFDESLKIKGSMQQNFVALLERRLDTTLFRSGFATSMFEARQLINHGHVYINDRRVNMPSVSLKDGDMINIKGLKNILANSISFSPRYLEIDYTNNRAVFLRAPHLHEITGLDSFNIKSIIEFYSR